MRIKSTNVYKFGYKNKYRCKINIIFILKILFILVKKKNENICIIKIKFNIKFCLYTYNKKINGSIIIRPNT